MSAIGMRKRDSDPINMTNGKPFRTKAQKEAAKNSASKGKDGAWHSNAPVSYHKGPKTN